MAAFFFEVFDDEASDAVVFDVVHDEEYHICGFSAALGGEVEYLGYSFVE